MFKLPKVFYSPDETIGGGSADTFDSLFGPEDDAEEKTLDLSDKSKDKEDDEEESEEKEEPEKELSEEELVIHTVPRKQEILKEFPTLFKKYPAIEAAIYRDRQFTEYFPTPADAKEAVEKSAAFETLHEKVMQGDTKDLLGGIKDEDPEAFKNVIDNFLFNLHDVDKEAYYHIIGTVASDMILKMVNIAKSKNNESVGIAAQILNQVVFGTDEYVPAQKLAKQLQHDATVEKEREEFARTRFDSAINDVATRTDNRLLKAINEHIDPDSAMTDYVKKIAVKEAFDDLNNIVADDKAFMAVIQSMWKRAVNNNFDKAAIDKIQSAYLSKAQTLLPKLIKKARNNAYKGMGKNVKVEKDRGGLVSPGKSVTQPNRGKSTAAERAKAIPAGMSSADYLLADD